MQIWIRAGRMAAFASNHVRMRAALPAGERHIWVQREMLLLRGA